MKTPTITIRLDDALERELDQACFERVRRRVRLIAQAVAEGLGTKATLVRV